MESWLPAQLDEVPLTPAIRGPRRSQLDEHVEVRGVAAGLQAIDGDHGPSLEPVCRQLARTRDHTPLVTNGRIAHPLNDPQRQW